MNKFSERLTELMEENRLTAGAIAASLKLANTSAVYKWKNGRKSVLLDTAAALADIFNCSLDYLFGRSDSCGTEEYLECPSFSVQLKTVLKEQGSSQNKIIKYSGINAHSLNNWLNNKGVPHIESIIKLADYFNVSMDYVVGREK